MTTRGLTVATHILTNEPEVGKAAAIFLLVGLDSTYTSVLAFTSVLSMFLDDLYDLRAELERREVEPAGQTTCDWLKI